MTDKALNITGLFSSVFGVSLPIFIPWGRTDNNYIAKEFEGVIPKEKPEYDTFSWMGTPVVGAFSLDGGVYQSYQISGEPTELRMPDFPMPYATIVEFTRGINLSETKVLGTNGTVKEIYGLSDWQINIRGFCITDNSRQGFKTMAEQANALAKFRQVTEAIGVTGELFNSKEIYSIVIKEMAFTPIQGNSTVMPFTITAVSDSPDILTI